MRELKYFKYLLKLVHFFLKLRENVAWIKNKTHLFMYSTNVYWVPNTGQVLF